MDSGDEESASLEVGMRVKARYRGGKEYYGGKITRVNADGSCAITYDDGDRELRVKPEHIKAEGGRGAGSRSSRTRGMDSGDEESASLEVGMRVKARYRGGKEYYGGKITRVNADGSCAITYDDGDRELRVKPEHIKAEGRGPGPVSYTHLTLPTTPYV